MKDSSKHSAIWGSVKGLLLCSALLTSIAFMAAPAAADSCSDLASLALPNTTITTAQSIASGRFIPPGSSTAIINLPAFCRVAAFVTPTSDSHIDFEVWIPKSIWNGKYAQEGCGGWCVSIPYGAMADPLRRGYAVAATDDGTGALSPTDASWANGHPEKVNDWAYRAVKVTHDDAEAIVAAFKSSGPRRSYFEGCSTGGRQALVEAQQYPQDFDGLIGGSPASIPPAIIVGFVWNFLALTETPDSSLTQSDLNILSSAVLTQCAGHDGGLATDQFLNNPPACKFNPESLLCTGNTTSSCLSEAKVAAIKKIYSGPPNIFPGYQVNEGTEAVLWPAGFVGQQSFFENFFSEWVFANSGWTPTSTTINQDLSAANASTAGITNFTNPDLTAFQKRGGKLIQYVGWSDPLISALNDINYYTSVTDVIGDLGATEQFYRLFMVPGMGHCAGGPGANAFGLGLNGPSPSDPSDDMLSALAQWVEQEIAPDKIIATKYVNDNPANGVAFQRPLCPYPQIAQYSGSGDATQANNWMCVEPRQ